MFAREDHVATVPALNDKAAQTHRAPLPLVHPRKYLQVIFEERRQLAAIFEERRQLAIAEIATVIPPDETFILVDGDEWATAETVCGRRRIPFLEQDGRYWGQPADDETAIRELKRLHRAAARFMVFGWPACWWLDYYRGLQDYLGSHFRCVLKNERLVVFDLRQ